MLTRMQSNWNSHALLVEMLSDKVTLENTFAVSCKVNQSFTICPILLLLDLYFREMKIYVHTETYTTEMCITTLFIITKIWKQPKFHQQVNRLKQTNKQATTRTNHYGVST